MSEKRQLTIKTNMVKRLSKELEMYVQDYEKEAAKFNKLKEDGADEHDIKYAEKLLNESSMMIPDTRQRLSSAVTELTSYLEEVGDALADAEEVPAAKVVLDAGKAVLDKTTVAV